MRLILLATAVSLAILAAASVAPVPEMLRPTPALASHANSPPPIWIKYLSSTPPDLRKIQWQACNMTGPQRNIAVGAFGNWPLFFVHDTNVQQMPPGCTTNYDLKVQPVPGSQIGGSQYCGQLVPACIRLTFNLNSDGRALVSKGSLYFNTGSYSLLTTDNQKKHMFAHEFGHAMSLGHHDFCGESVMSPFAVISGPNVQYCEDLVHHGPYPNDLCTPVYMFYYSDYGLYC